MKKALSTADLYSTAFVAGLFNSMSATYGFTNYVSSFGFTEKWRHRCIQQLPYHPQLIQGYDLMTGMGEIWASLTPRFEKAEVTGVDISPLMLAQATRNAAKSAYTLSLLQADVLQNELPANSADFIISSFGLKTFNTRQLDQLAVEVNRLLKPGGVFSFVEISVPPNALQPFYMFYLKRIIPLIGKLFQGDSDNYRMLGIYTEKFRDCSLFYKQLEEKGLQVQFSSYFAGCATGVCGKKV